MSRGKPPDPQKQSKAKSKTPAWGFCAFRSWPSGAALSATPTPIPSGGLGGWPPMLLIFCLRGNPRSKAGNLRQMLVRRVELFYGIRQNLDDPHHLGHHLQLVDPTDHPQAELFQLLIVILQWLVNGSTAGFSSFQSQFFVVLGVPRVKISEKIRSPTLRI